MRNEINNKIRVYSFDIFDTVLTRNGKKPIDIFKLIQKQLEISEDIFPEKFIKEFASIREKCECDARNSALKEDITFDALYNYIGEKNNLNKAQTDKLKFIELEVELNSVKPIEWTISEINSLRKIGEKIVFTTEMYLPREHIKKMLQKVGAYENNNKIYVSGEIGLLKNTGNLFKYILKKEKCLPENFYHFGDHLMADMIVPFRLGINIYKTSAITIKKEIWKLTIKNIKNKLLFLCARIYRIFFPKKS